MMTDIKESHYSNDIEKYGYLQKKTSKGLWVNRYFVTETNYLLYWHELLDYDAKKPPSEKYDISEIKSIEKIGTHIITMNFMDNSKFKLEVKTAQVIERNEWFTVLEAKKRLYSVNELLNDIRSERISFRTRTFQTLMQLQEREQNKWILDRLDEAFETSNDHQFAQQLRSNSNRLLLAATKAVEEFISSCEDCEQEMASREPKIIAHSRNYIRRYADILKGRISLELLYLPGIENKQFEMLEEKALCTALVLSNKIDSLTKYSFLSKDFIPTISRTLFSTGDLISALIKLAVYRIDSFFEMILAATLDVRMKKLIEIQSVLGEFLSLLKEDLTDENLFQLVIQKVITTQLLAFADHLLLLDITSYNESALVDHIYACETIFHVLSHSFVDLHTRQLCYDEALTANTVMNMSVKLYAATPSKTASVSLPERRGSAPAMSPIPHYYFLPKDILELIHSTCTTSSRKAIQKAIADLEIGRQYLLKGLLQESSEGWIGGVICMALIHNLNQWLDTFISLVPEKYTYTIHLEVGQVMITMYMKHLIILYKSERSGMQLSNRGIVQLQNDFEYIYNWIVQNSTISSIAAAASTASKEEAQNEKEFLQMIQHFLLCTDATALKLYADALLTFGIRYKYHIYDLLRLILKIRSDISNKIRKLILGICNEFTNQLELAITTDPKLLEGKLGSKSPLLEEIFPLAGIEHCTGMKWKTETPSDPIAIRLTVSLMVTTILNQAVVMKKEKNAYAVENSNIASVSMDSYHENNGNENGNSNRRPSVPSRLISRDQIPSNRYVSPQSIRTYPVEPTVVTKPAGPPTGGVAENVKSSLASVPEESGKTVEDSATSVKRPYRPPPPPPPRKTDPLTQETQNRPNKIDSKDLTTIDLDSETKRASATFPPQKIDTNPFSEAPEQISNSSVTAAASGRLPPPKPTKRKSNTDGASPSPETSSEAKDTNLFSIEDSDSTKNTQIIKPLKPPSRNASPATVVSKPLTPQEALNIPQRTQAIKPLKPPSRSASPATVASKPLTPQEALNVLLASAQKNLADKLDS